MKQILTSLCLTIAVLLGSAGVSWSDESDDLLNLLEGLLEGFNAYEGGDYATALREWKPLAEQGDASAQYSLGVMYKKGQGVLN